MGPCLSKSGAEERALRPRQNRYDDLLTNYQQGPPTAATPAIGAPMRNPIASPQDIEQAGSRGSHNEAFGAYSWNGRNGYNEKEGEIIRGGTGVSAALPASLVALFSDTWMRSLPPVHS
jgi:hypothetical protein